jgi:hypothetical protein
MTHPDINDSLLKLQCMERLKECLEIRLTLCRTDYSLKNENERNEIEILTLKTDLEIQRLDGVIRKEKAELTELFETYLDEVKFNEEFKE